MRALFVDPEIVRLPLFDDGQYWIEVKAQLNAGEATRLAASALRMKRITASDAESNEGAQDIIDFDFEAHAFQKVLIYLLDWNLTDNQGRAVSIETPKAKRDALGKLHPDVLGEIRRAIDAHAETRQEKKQMSGSLTPGAAS